MDDRSSPTVSLRRLFSSGLFSGSFLKNKRRSSVTSADNALRQQLVRRASAPSTEVASTQAWEEAVTCTRKLVRDTKPHWLVDDDNFRLIELEKRSQNEQLSAHDAMDNSWSHTKLFFSHCWRDVTTQERKRHLFSTLTEDGAVFWCDFLDLQAQGPVPWRNEISQAIQACSKTVALIDEQYLLSYNCLEELAYAIHYQKPIVLGILDQAAWNTLTIVNGHLQAWVCEPASGGRPLSHYKGQGFGPNAEPFSVLSVQSIFSTLASINFCPCRELDVTNIGAASVAERLVEFVNKDLEYTKEHAFLQLRAETWDSVRRPDNLLLERRADVEKWGSWVEISSKARFFPPPTTLQRAYVTHSQWRYTRRSTCFRVAGIVLMAVIMVLAVLAGLAAFVAFQKSRESRANELQAVWQQRVAASMALSSVPLDVNSGSLVGTVMARRILRAAELAKAINFTALVMPSLVSTISLLAKMPYWVIDINTRSTSTTGISFSPDGEYLASAGVDGTIRIRKLPSRKFYGMEVLPGMEEEVILYTCSGPALAVSWSPSGSHLAASCGIEAQDDSGIESSSSPFVVIWDRQYNTSSSCFSSMHEFDLGGDKAAETLSWSPDSAMLATGDTIKRIWYIAEAASSGTAPESKVLQYKGEKSQSRVAVVTWGPEGKLLASGGTNSRMTLWEVGDSLGDPAELLSVNKLDEDINDLAFSSDGKFLASATDALQVKVWDVASHSAREGLKLVQTLPANGASVTGVAWSSTGELATASEAGVVQIFKWQGLPTVEESAGRSELHLHQELTSPARHITGLIYAPRQPSLLMAGTKAGLVRGWQEAIDLSNLGPESFKMNCTQEMLDEMGEELMVRAGAWSPDGNTFAVGSYRGYVCLWERPENATWGHPVVLGWDQPGMKRRKACRIVTFDNSGDQLAAGDDLGAIHVWRRAVNAEISGGDSWQQVSSTSLDQGKLQGLHFSLDGRWLAGSTHLGTISVLDPADPDMTTTILEGHKGSVRAVGWKQEIESSGCMILASGGEDDHSLRLWDLCSSGSGSLVEPLVVRNRFAVTDGPTSHSAGVRALEWSSEGELASSGEDGRLLVHSFGNGGEPETLQAEMKGHMGEGLLLSWSPNGRQLVTASSDRTVRVWDLNGVRAHQNNTYTVWRVNTLTCRYLRWLKLKPYRLACARDTVFTNSPDTLHESPPFTYWMEYIMLEYEYQRELLRSLTYGELTANDLVAIGFESIATTALNQELIEAKLPMRRMEGSHNLTGMCSMHS